MDTENEKCNCELIYLCLYHDICIYVVKILSSFSRGLWLFLIFQSDRVNSLFFMPPLLSPIYNIVDFAIYVPYSTIPFKATLMSILATFTVAIQQELLIHHIVYFCHCPYAISGISRFSFRTYVNYRIRNSRVKIVEKSTNGNSKSTDT